MKLFVYCLREFDEKGYFDEAAAEFGCEWSGTPAYPSPDNVCLAKGYDAVAFTPCEMGRDMLDRFHAVGVRYIAARSIGFDHIDLAHATRLGMGVCRVSYAPETVADYAIMLMLMSLRKICHILDRAAVQDFSLRGKLGRDLCACTVGVIGTGQIGRTVVRHLSAFGCRTVAFDPFPDPETAKLAEYLPLEELYRVSDVISLHAPASAENYHLLDREAFACMKPGAVVVNTARGSLIDTDALIDALERGQVGAAALDVLEKEDGLYYASRIGDVIPNREMAILRSFPNVILSPHTAFYTARAVRAMARGCVSGVCDMVTGTENSLILVHPQE